MPRPGPRTTNKYSERFKATAVKLSELPGVAVQDVAAEFKALRRMKRDYERLKLEHELVEKAIEFTSQRRARSSSSSKPRSTRSRSA